MKAKYISYQDTHSFSKLVIDYVHDIPQLKDFYSYRPDLDGLKKAVENRNFKGSRQVLVETLQSQYSQISVNRAVSNNIKLLAEESTFTVTTGHQLNLFTGPLYFIYKIVTTINLAIELKIKFPDKNFVPIYWMATEDHDFDEINHVNVEDGNISWIEQTNGATGRLSTKNVRAAVRAYKGYLGISPNGKKLARLIDEAYLENDNLADATRVLVNRLFEQYGLVIVNADDRNLKDQFKTVIGQDITQQHSDNFIGQTNKSLHNLGYATQVNGREINFFYLKDNLRERILKTEDGYAINNTSLVFSTEELQQEINQHPDRFSPNVVMRPLYQEMILPNIAYIGGGAEVAYWMQLKANFDYYKIDFPVLLLRNSALVVDDRTAKNLRDLGFSLADAFLPTEQLKNQWVARNTTAKLSLTNETNQLLQLLDQVKLEASEVEKTLIASGDALKAKAIRLFQNFEKKMFRAEKRKHETSLQQIENVKNRLFPSGTLQERLLNLAPMYVNYGDDFISSCIENFEPLGGDFTVLLPD